MKDCTAIERTYVQSVSLEHRKKFAQFFTPDAIAELMAEWLLQNKELQSVLEPAFGLGVFSRQLLKAKEGLAVKGFEIDPLIFGEAERLFSCSQDVQLILQDYMYNDWENKYDGIICNPPYFKFHDYDNKGILKEMEKRLSCRLNGFTNLYTLFLLKSIHQLKPNGRCAYIVPSEFLNSDYGTLVKSYLVKTRTLRHIIVFNFEENVFDDALTTACIILCANSPQQEKVRFTTIDSAQDLSAVREVINGEVTKSCHSQSYSLDELDVNIKWKNYYQKHNGRRFKNLVPFSQYAKVMRGIATGANDYFTFNMSKAQSFHISEEHLLPCICKCVDVKKAFFTQTDFEELKQNDRKVFLLNALKCSDAHVLDYIRRGEEEGIDKKYLTASRNPWYALEKRPPAPIWVSVFNRTGLRFVRNMTQASNLTTFHCVYPITNLFSEVSVDLLFAYLTTDTAREIFEANSREYGNGLQKFEPNDLNKGMMLDLAKLPDKVKRKIENLYRFNQEDTSGSEIDEILMEYFL